MTQAGRTFQLPPQTYVAVVVNGRLTAVFPGVNYWRKVNEIQVVADAESGVDIYRGIIASPQRIATNPIGSNNTFNPANRPEVPPGFAVFVVWPDLTSGVASATITFEGKL